MGAPDEFHPEAHEKAKEITGNRNYGEWGQCVSSRNSVDERCRGYALGPHGKCHNHGGKSTGPKTDEGKQRVSGNAQKHALRATRSKFYERLSNDRQTEVDRMEKALIERYQENHGRAPDPADVKDVFEIAVGYVLRDYARDYLVECMEESGNPMLEHVEFEKDGEEVEFDKPNELLEQIDSNRREDRMQRKDKGLEKDPESRKASALESGIDLTITKEEKEQLVEENDVEPDI